MATAWAKATPPSAFFIPRAELSKESCWCLFASKLKVRWREEATDGEAVAKWQIKHRILVLNMISRGMRAILPLDIWRE